MKKQNLALADEFKRMQENYQVSKQILLDTINVKLFYENIIQ